MHVWNPQLEQHVLLETTEASCSLDDDEEDGSIINGGDSENNVTKGHEIRNQEQKNHDETMPLVVTGSSSSTSAVHEGPKLDVNATTQQHDDDDDKTSVRSSIVVVRWGLEGMCIGFVLGLLFVWILPSDMSSSSSRFSTILLRWNVVVVVVILLLLLMFCAPLFTQKHRLLNWFRDYGRQRCRNEINTCRNQLSFLLGSIGAPPPPPLGMTMTTSMSNDDASVLLSSNTVFVGNMQCLVKCCQAHVDLIRQVDDCLRMLRTAMSMYVHCTPRIVHRVEQVVLNQHRATRGNRHYQSNNKKRIVLAVARTRLVQVMVRQYQQLHALIKPMTDDDDNNDNNDIIDIPNVITLAWLKCLRDELANLLSHRCYQCVSSTTLLSSSRKVSNVELLQVCTETAMEATTYLASLFAMPSRESCSIAATIRLDSSKSKSNNVAAELHVLSRQWDKAAVALWAACQEAATNDDSVDDCRVKRKEEDDDDRKAHDTAVLEFVQHLEQQLLESVGKVKERLRDQQQQQLSNRPSGPKQVSTVDGVATRRTTIGNTTLGDYEDIGKAASTRDDPSIADNVQVNNRRQLVRKHQTVVFVGSGSVPRSVGNDNDHQGNGRESNESTTAEAISSNHEYAAVQGRMLCELQKRLAQMEPIGQVDGQGNAIIVDDDDEMSAMYESSTTSQKESSPNEASSSSPFMFLGATGDLLGELKNVIS